MRSLIPNGIKGMIFGDIYPQERKDWVDRVCGELGIEAVEPLWKKDPGEIILDFMDLGFEAMIVKAKADLFAKEWIGQVKE